MSVFNIHATLKYVPEQNSACDMNPEVQ